MIIVSTDAKASSASACRRDWRKSARTLSATENNLKMTYYTPSTEVNHHEIGSFDRYEYRIEHDGTIYITRWYGSDEILAVPAEMNGLKVSGISRNAFSLSQQLREIVIPEGVKEIEEYAFALCTKLEKVTLPESLNRIAENAFVSCPEGISFLASEGSFAADWSGK